MKQDFMKAAPILLLLLFLPVLVFVAERGQHYIGRAREIPANIVIETNNITGPLPHNWKALAQGGEEKGVRMLANVLSDTAELSPRYIRIDHMYDFYDVVRKDRLGSLVFQWDQLDATVCDILRIGARPFFSLGYMPELLSTDGSLIDAPRNWQEWELLVQSTVERYSAKDPRICGPAYDSQLTDVYYEVWNEPDLETFGKWSIHGGRKDYKLLYYYSAQGAQKAQGVQRFFLGGPAITAVYQNWMQLFLRYANAYQLRVDFLSWHHYSSDPAGYRTDMVKVDAWLTGDEFERYRTIPRIISEWGFDSNPNPLSETEIAAAHTIATIRHLVEEKLEMAFAFEIKDGQEPRWGIMSYTGAKKPRYYGLKLLNVLGRSRLTVTGEGTWVSALASREFGTIAAVIVNYDLTSTHHETVPVTFTGLPAGRYQLTQQDLTGVESSAVFTVNQSGTLSRILSMKPNSAYALQLKSL